MRESSESESPAVPLHSLHSSAGGRTHEGTDSTSRHLLCETVCFMALVWLSAKDTDGHVHYENCGLSDVEKKFLTMRIQLFQRFEHRKVRGGDLLSVTSKNIQYVVTRNFKSKFLFELIT